MFLSKLSSDPHFFVYVVVTMVISVVLHELAHGWAAIWQGDRTPIELGHMTIDPRVHMGAASLILLALAGMCFGAMPVDPTRFRSRHSDMIVSFAGPLMNLLLAFLALTTLGIWNNIGDSGEQSMVQDNLRQFLWVFGYCNVALCVFNLIPIPPLDGSTVLAGISKGYKRMIESVRDPMIFMIAFAVLFVVLSSEERSIYRLGAYLANEYLGWIYSLA